jgi:hypothetical protein
LRDRFVAKRLALAAFVMVVVALVFYLRSVTPFGGVHARRCFRMAWCRK